MNWQRRFRVIYSGIAVIMVVISALFSLLDLSRLYWQRYQQLLGTGSSITEHLSALSQALSETTKSLDELQRLDDIQRERESKTVLAEKLQHDIKTSKELVELNQKQIEALGSVLRSELQTEAQRSWWPDFWFNIIVNFDMGCLFVVVGIIVEPYLVTQKFG